VTVRKGNNWRSDRCIAINLLLEFADALFHECIRNRYSVMKRSGRARLDGRFTRAITFHPTVGSRSIFYWSFRMLFSMEWMRNRNSMMMWSGRARLDGRFARAITFDPTVGWRSNFYSSFRMPFSMEWMRNGYSVMMRSGLAWLE